MGTCAFFALIVELPKWKRDRAVELNCAALYWAALYWAALNCAALYLAQIDFYSLFTLAKTTWAINTGYAHMRIHNSLSAFRQNFKFSLLPPHPVDKRITLPTSAINQSCGQSISAKSKRSGEGELSVFFSP